MNKTFYVILGDMTVGGPRPIFITTNPWWPNEAIAKFDTNQKAEDFITKFLEDDDYDEYYHL